MLQRISLFTLDINLGLLPNRRWEVSMGGEKKRTLCCQNTRRLNSENKTLSSTSLWRKYYVPTFHNLLVNFMLIFTFFQLTKISFTNLLTYLRLVRQMSFREIGIFKHSILRKTSSIHFLCVKLFRLCSLRNHEFHPLFQKDSWSSWWTWNSSYEFFTKL